MIVNGFQLKMEGCGISLFLVIWDNIMGLQIMKGEGRIS